MAITGSMFNTLTFGNVNSGDYGIYISGEGVFNAPERAVEMISVPGRNGDVALDLGRYENIEVEYPAGIFGDDTTDFSERLSDFRNAILSQKGYQRLSDTYHPNEFRFGLYSSGLEVVPVHYTEAGEFTLTFNCKPQRWLIDGETSISVQSGDVLSNPTLFESSPLLDIDGYGKVQFNGFSIDVSNVPIGNIVVGRNESLSPEVVKSISVQGLPADNGDEVTLRGLTIEIGQYNATAPEWPVFEMEIRHVSGAITHKNFSYDITDGGMTTLAYLTINDIALDYGSSDQFEGVFNIGYAAGGGSAVQMFETYLTLRISISDNVVSIYFEVDTRLSYPPLVLSTLLGTLAELVVDSTTAVADIIVDCENGNAYRIDSGNYLDFNGYISLGSDLPKLSPGDNTIIFDNTIRDLKIAPRWWKL